MKRSLTILGVVALVLAVTVPATASHLHRVFSRNIVNGTIRSVDIDNGTIQARDVRPNGLGTGRITNGSLRLADLHSSTRSALNDFSSYRVFTITQNFGPGGIGGAWCGAPNANTEDRGWRVVGGGAELTSADIDAGIAVASSWPNLSDPLNPGWNVQVNKPAGVDPGEVTLYAVCLRR
jgi:hypothetical protein